MLRRIKNILTSDSNPDFNNLKNANLLINQIENFKKVITEYQELDFNLQVLLCYSHLNHIKILENDVKKVHVPLHYREELKSSINDFMLIKQQIDGRFIEFENSLQISLNFAKKINISPFDKFINYEHQINKMEVEIYFEHVEVIYELYAPFFKIVNMSNIPNLSTYNTVETFNKLLAKNIRIFKDNFDDQTFSFETIQMKLENSTMSGESSKICDMEE